MKLQARHFETGLPIEVTVEGDAIASIRSLDTTATLPWIAPGLFDLQVNGFGNIWFGDDHLTVEQVITILEAYRTHGMTRVCPTLITNSREVLEHGFNVVREACERYDWVNWMVAGCHLEGPFLASEDGPRGAHHRDQVRGCNWEEFESWQRASGNRIRLVTVAAESAGAPEFIRRATAAGVVVSIGHTAANSAQIEAAVDAGASLSTHLGNGAHAVLPRHPNYLWDQLGEPRLSASVISDGFHIPPSFLRSVYFAKGADKVIITCDASGLAGCAPGEYGYLQSRYEVLEDGRIVVAGQRNYLAGSGAFTESCVGWAVKILGCSLAEAWRMASVNPAKLLNVTIASLEPGSAADLVLFDHDPVAGRIDVRQTVTRGEVVYSR
ncbi:N-acetylglucosamine-6-phosphate deacetylase [Planctomicrobium sp. SH664]|uniref:N-acetylglucosamine-6-phosphate deacetylase n=1 Tax=Planctomicrobium sp. SH664 TaxID=3448125 RepID=UPI003F5B6666